MPKEVVEDITQSLRETHKDKCHFHKTLLENYQTEYRKYEERIEKMYEDKLDGSITESYYNKKRAEFRAKQKELNKKMEKLNFAYELFESSEPQEKRVLLKETLQNLELVGSLVRYNEIKPYDKIRLYASRQDWLALGNVFRTYEWLKPYQPIDLTFVTLQQIIYPHGNYLQVK